jgi:hypothetical protein
VGNLSGKSTRSSVLAAIADKLPDGITVTPALRGEILQLVRSIKIPREHKFPDEDFLAFRTAAGVARKPFGQWLLYALRGEVRRSVLAGAARGENVSQRQILYVQGLPKE